MLVSMYGGNIRLAQFAANLLYRSEREVRSQTEKDVDQEWGRVAWHRGAPLFSLSEISESIGFTR